MIQSIKTSAVNDSVDIECCYQLIKICIFYKNQLSKNNDAQIAWEIRKELETLKTIEK